MCHNHLQGKTSSKVVFSSWFLEKLDIFHKKFDKIAKMLPSQEDDTKLSTPSQFTENNFKPIWEGHKYLFWNLKEKSRFLMSTFKIHHLEMRMSKGRSGWIFRKFCKDLSFFSVLRVMWQWIDVRSIAMTSRNTSNTLIEVRESKERKICNFKAQAVM